MIPAFWFAQTVELNEQLAKSAKVNKNWRRIPFKFGLNDGFMSHSIQIAIQLPSIGLYLAFGVSGLGIILLAVGAILTYTKSWSAYENLDDEPSTAENTNSNSS